MNSVDSHRRRALAENRPLRLFTLFILYVAQGVPIGLFWFAIPAWMAANGATPEQVGSVLGLTALPWTLKLVNGFIMDRYTFLPMGRRRVWIIGAQALMILLLIGCAAAAPDVTDVLLLGLASCVVNLATTFQDVAVDGLAVDIMEEQERSKASGMMFGGQSIGIAASTALSGLVIARFGPAAAYLVSAGIIGLITLYMAVLRERPGERLLPWGAGEAHPRNHAIHLGAWRPILGSTFRAMILPVSLLWVPVLLVRGFHYGVLTGVTPLIGTGEVGWTEETVTGLVATAQLASGVVGMTIGGWLGDRFGAKKSSIAMFFVFMAVSATMWLSVAHWGNPRGFTAFVYGWLVVNILLTVVTLPISMRLCDPRVAATQFTLYMALHNFGISIGAWALGFSAKIGGLPTMFALVFAMHFVGLVLMLVVKFPRRSVIEQQVGAQLAEGLGPEPPHN